MGKIIDFSKNWKNQRSYFVWLVSYSMPYIPRIILIMALGLADTILSVGLAVILKKLLTEHPQAEWQRKKSCYILAEC